MAPRIRGVWLRIPNDLAFFGVVNACCIPSAVDRLWDIQMAVKNKQPVGLLVSSVYSR